MSNYAKPTTEGFQSQLEFFLITPKVQDRIQGLKPRLMKYVKISLATLFDHVKGNPDVEDYFFSPEANEYLKAGMIAHCELVFEMRYDKKYYDAVDQMGQRHAKLGYPNHAYTAAYANLLTGIMAQALNDKKPLAPRDITDLMRTGIYDMELTMAAHFRYKLESQRALAVDTAKLKQILQSKRWVNPQRS